jgi:hypothetical protein
MQSAEFSLVLGDTLLLDRKTGSGVPRLRLDALSADGATTDYCSGKKPNCCGLTSVSDQRNGVLLVAVIEDLAALAWLWALVTIGVVFWDMLAWLSSCVGV